MRLNVEHQRRAFYDVARAGRVVAEPFVHVQHAGGRELSQLVLSDAGTAGDHESALRADALRQHWMASLRNVTATNASAWSTAST